MGQALKLCDGPKRIVFRMVWHVFWIVCAGLLFVLVWKEALAVENVTEYILRQGASAFSAEEIAALNGKSRSYVISGLAPFSGTADGRSVQIVAADEHFQNFHRIEMLRGAWFSATEAGAVIDTDLAVALFFTENAVGQTLDVQGEALPVVGVYKANHSFLQKISLQNRAPVFLPFQSLADMPKDAAYLYIKETGKDGGLERVSFAAIQQLDLDTKGAFLLRYQDTEMHEKEWSMAQMGQILWAGAAWVLAFFAGALCFRTSKRFAVWHGEMRKRHEPVSRRMYGKKLLLPMISGLFAAGMLAFSHFSPYLPDHFLPTDRHLLNLAHYADYFAREALSRKLYALPQYYDLLFYNGTVLLFALAAVVWVQTGKLAALLFRLLAQSDSKIQSPQKAC